MSNTKLIQVDCPHCGNYNRAARRKCKRDGGMCGGTGKVMKSVPAVMNMEVKR